MLCLILAIFVRPALSQNFIGTHLNGAYGSSIAKDGEWIVTGAPGEECDGVPAAGAVHVANCF